MGGDSLFGSPSGDLPDDIVQGETAYSYTWFDTVRGDRGEQANVYRVERASVPEVARDLAERATPDHVSEASEERMILSYPDELVSVYRDVDQAEDTLVEVASTTFVRNNYSPSFLEGYLLGSLIGNIFGSGWQNRDWNRPYRGYIGPDRRYSTYGGAKGATGGSIRQGSSGTRFFRGGGLGVGK